MLVSVTSKHIAKAKRTRARDIQHSAYSHCPVALAIQGHTGNPNWRVGRRACWLDDGSEPGMMMNYIQLPQAAIDAIRTFDETCNMDPFKIYLPVTD